MESHTGEARGGGGRGDLFSGLLCFNPFFDTLEMTPVSPNITGSVSKPAYHEKGVACG